MLLAVKYLTQDYTVLNVNTATTKAETLEVEARPLNWLNLPLDSSCFFPTKCYQTNVFNFPLYNGL